MVKAPIPEDEETRLHVLQQYQILDTAAEKVFDDITELAAKVCQTPIALLGFVDRGRTWFKSNVGLSVHETSRDVAMCAHAIAQKNMFVVPDAQNDPRFAQSPLVVREPHVRFYAGVPLITPEGCAVGTLCVIDRVPRELTQEQAAKLRALGESAVMLLEMRRGRN